MGRGASAFAAPGARVMPSAADVRLPIRHREHSGQLLADQRLNRPQAAKRSRPTPPRRLRPDILRALAMGDVLIDPDDAVAFLEFCRWGHDGVCPHCGVNGRLGRLRGNGQRHGIFKCYACRRFFNVRTGTPLEGSHLSAPTILAAVYLIVATEGMIGPTTLAIHLGITPQTALKFSRKVRSVLQRAGVLDVSGVEMTDAKCRLKEALRDAKAFHAPESPLTRKEREQLLCGLATSFRSKRVDALFVTAVKVLLAPWQPESAFGDGVHAGLPKEGTRVADNAALKP